MNANIPTLHVHIPRTFLTDGRETKGTEQGYAFAISSTKGRALCFHVMLKSGAHFRGIPLHALHSRPPAASDTLYTLEDLALWDCYDSETEVLSRRGWRRFADLRPQDELATVNLATDTLEYQHPTRLIRKPYKGDMVTLGGGPRQRVNVMVTPTHRMVVVNGDGTNPVIRTAQDLRYYDKLKLRVSNWHGEESEIKHLAEIYYEPAVDVNAEDFATLMGWFVSEGCVCNRTVFISQKQGKKRDSIWKLVSRLPWRWRNSGDSIATNSEQLARELRHLGNVYTKRVPQWIKDSSPRLIRAFLRAAVDGDGCRENGKDRYYTASPLLADDIQELYLKIGSRATIRVKPAKPYCIRGRTGTSTTNLYVVNEAQTACVNLSSGRVSLIKRTPYEGEVFCATVPNGTLIVRRGGKPIVCGNCFSWRPVVTVFDYLADHQCTAVLRNRQRVPARYCFTVDWLPDSAESPGLTMQPEQNKCAHVLELESGQYAALPTNRVIWRDGYFIGNEPKPEKAGYLAATTVWRAETCEKWSVAEDDRQFYGVEEAK